MKQLAIVIPAYKIDFFRATLDSLAAQTCKDFTVYVGDDCSPSDFGGLIEEYNDRLDIRYTKFDTNLGGKDLVAQWTRCIDLTEGEPWLWLFSDDDVMGEKCVEFFYKEIEKDAKYDIYHFDVKVINDNGSVIKEPKSYPNVFYSKAFYMAKGNGTIESFVVENIFSRKIYNEVNGFEPFELAWGSDAATWTKMAQNKGIKTIKGACVLWRSSEKNITPQVDRAMSMRKLKINIDNIAWSSLFFHDTFDIKRFNFLFLLRRVRMYSKNVNKNDLNEILDYARSINAISFLERLIIRLLFPFLKIINP